jgi:hypothetical protein
MRKMATATFILFSTLACEPAVAIEADSLDQITIGEKSERTSQHYS